MIMKATTAKGRWGKKKKNVRKKKVPVFIPSCVSTVASSWTEKYTEHVRSSKYTAEVV